MGIFRFTAVSCNCRRRWQTKRQRLIGAQALAVVDDDENLFRLVPAARTSPICFSICPHIVFRSHSTM